MARLRQVVRSLRRPPRGGRFQHGEAGVKPVRAIDWAETTTSESELAERCAAGDRQAFQELVHGHQRMVYHLALQLLGNPRTHAISPRTCS